MDKKPIENYKDYLKRKNADRNEYFVMERSFRDGTKAVGTVYPKNKDYKDKKPYSTNPFIICVGSDAKEPTERVKTGYSSFIKERNELIEKGIIKDNKFVIEYETKTPSRAAMFISGIECDGFYWFVNKDGKRLADITAYRDDNLEDENIISEDAKESITEEIIEESLIFSDNKIQNRKEDGSPYFRIRTKREPLPEAIEDAYKALGYEEILLDSAPAINLNHTSLFVAEKLCNALPDEFWNDEEIYKRRILNPFGDSGFLEKYIIRRLMDNEVMKKEFPDYSERLYHILHNMLFSVAKTNAASYWLRKIVYYSADATITGLDREDYPTIFHGRLFSVGGDEDKLESYKKYGNIKSPWIEGVIGENNIFNYPMLDWIKSGKDVVEYFALVFWDVFTNEKYEEIEEERRIRIMSEIKSRLKGYFDVIIGNPPYNTNDEETGKVGETIYNYFCLAADKLEPKYESFIIPSKWAYGKARIPKEFSQSVLTNKHLCYFELIDGEKAFPSVQPGEISIYTLDNTREYDKIKYIDWGTESNEKMLDILRSKGNDKVFSRPDSIIKKVRSKITQSIADNIRMFSLKSGIIYDKYGDDLLRTSACGFRHDNGRLVILPDGTKGKRPTLDYSLVKTETYNTKFFITRTKLWRGDYPVYDDDKCVPHIYIDPRIISDYCGNNNHKKLVVVPPRWNYHQKLLDFPYNAYILNTDEYTAYQFAAGWNLKTDIEIENLLRYLKTKFVTYLAYQNAVSQNFSSDSLAFVPEMDFTQDWTDERLNKFFELTADEIHTIDTLFSEFKQMGRAQLIELSEKDEAEEEEVLDEEN